MIFIKAIKSFGQNFLQDKNIINKIVNLADIKQEDLIIEIGPGQGALTKELKKKNAQILAFEIDLRMHEVLDSIVDDKTNIVYEDILSVDLNSILSMYKYNKLYVIANLPYYITSPIVEKLLTLNIKIDEIVIMVQNEVADRFSAIPKSRDYGFMTVLINSKYNVKKEFVVKNTCFLPVPKVDSAVVRLSSNTNLKHINNYLKFKELLSQSFAHKRKTLRNNLSSDVWDKILPILVDSNYPLSVRAEELPVDVYIEMSNIL